MQLPSRVNAGGALTQYCGSAGPPSKARTVTVPTVSSKIGGLLSERIAMCVSLILETLNGLSESMPCHGPVHFNRWLCGHFVSKETGQKAGACAATTERVMTAAAMIGAQRDG